MKTVPCTNDTNRHFFPSKVQFSNPTHQEAVIYKFREKHAFSKLHFTQNALFQKVWFTDNALSVKSALFDKCTFMKVHKKRTFRA
jgi:hypothetical protein